MRSLHGNDKPWRTNGKARVWLIRVVNSKGKNVTISYLRFLAQKKLGRELTVDEYCRNKHYRKGSRVGVEKLPGIDDVIVLNSKERKPKKISKSTNRSGGIYKFCCADNGAKGDKYLHYAFNSSANYNYFDLVFYDDLPIEIKKQHAKYSRPDMGVTE